MKLKIGILACAALAVAAAFGQARSPLLRRGLAAAPASAAPAAGEGSAFAAAAADDEEAASDLNFNNSPIEMVFETYGKLVDRTVLKDPQTPSATITLQSRPGQKLTKEEQIEAIEVVCEMNGIHFENYGEKFVRALPRKGVRKEGIPLIMDPAATFEDSGKVVSVMIPFKNISVKDEAEPMMKNLVSGSGELQTFERTNSILVTDTQQNINRLIEVAKSVDIAMPVLENVFVRQIKNASATEIKAALEQIVIESQKELEKSGRAQQNAAASAASRAPQPTLLRRPGANNAAPAAPSVAESLITSVSDADRGLIRGKVLILADERSNKLVVITSKSNMDFFDKVIEQLDVETTPDTVVKVYRLKYADAEDVSDMINDLIGNAANAKSSSKSNQNANAKSGGNANVTRNTASASNRSASANQRTGEAKAGELSKENTTVLADKRINGLVVMTQKELVGTLENIIESMDVKLSQVLIETVIVEVTLGDDLKTGIDWVMRGRQRAKVQATDSYGRPLYIATDDDGNVTHTTEETDTPLMVTRIVRDGLVNNGNFMLGGGGGNGSGVLGTMMSVGTNVASAAAWGGANPISGGLNYFLKSDKLNLAAVIQASKSDSRSKYIASPIVMTVDNKEATIDATENRQFLTGWTAQSGSYGNSGQPTPNYSAKDIGIKLKITPKINPNGTVMLTVEEEYSQFHENGQSMLIPKNGVYESGFVDLAVERKMSADILLDNMQTVVLGGLTETTKAESESGIPILKDIPWIGRWLFGSVSQVEARKELLVFMTPYVLDDGEMAQAEALRRKRALSDTRPWDDNGWSASSLADPVSQKEQLRRLKDEAKKQDEERKTRRAIEQWKEERVKALEKMDEEEREAWLKKHQDEVRQEQAAYAEEQAQLRALAEEIRANREQRAAAEAEAAAPAAEGEAAP